MAVALVAVARKLAILGWHLLSKGTDYQWAPTRLVADKMRKIERRAGYHHARGTLRGSEVREVQREQERRVLAQAEEAYRTLVAARRGQGDAAATKRGAS